MYGKGKIDEILRSAAQNQKDTVTAEYLEEAASTLNVLVAECDMTAFILAILPLQIPFQVFPIEGNFIVKFGCR